MHDKDEVEESRMPLWEHLDELRSRLIKCLVAVGIVSCVTYGFAEPVVRFLERPLLDVLPAGEGHLYFTGIADKFFAYLKVSVLTAVAITSPYLLWQFWLFIAPALYRNERRFVAPFLCIGTLAFFSGAAFGYTVVLPAGYRFLIQFGSPLEKPIITIAEYFALTLKLLLAMGLVFEVPVLMVLLARFGIVRSEMLRRYRRQAIFINSVLAAFITPTPDAFTLLLVMVPLCLLYEAGIVGVRWVERIAPADETAVTAAEER